MELDGIGKQHYIIYELPILPILVLPQFIRIPVLSRIRAPCAPLPTSPPLTAPHLTTSMTTIFFFLFSLTIHLLVLIHPVSSTHQHHDQPQQQQQPLLHAPDHHHHHHNHNHNPITATTTTTTMSKSLNIFKQPLALHSTTPITGFLRNGYCEVPTSDFGNHSIAAEVTEEYVNESPSLHPHVTYTSISPQQIRFPKSPSPTPQKGITNPNAGGAEQQTDSSTSQPNAATISAQFRG
jgi:hypothetical protein